MPSDQYQSVIMTKLEQNLLFVYMKAGIYTFSTNTATEIKNNAVAFW